MSINIAIDGPSGAGKSSISKELAQKLAFIYVDTGALYRAVALYMVQNNVDIQNPDDVEKNLESLKLSFKHTEQGQRVFVGEQDVSDSIRTNEVSMAASKVSGYPAVREFLLSLQKNIAQENDVIMDGRDIGTVILPDAQVKIFLTASAQERARRRFEELKATDPNADYDEILRLIEKRDYDDIHRDVSPLKKAQDAIEIDSTNLSKGQVVDAIYQIVDEKTKKKNLHMKSIS